MKINNNIQALNAYRNLFQNQEATSKNLEKLSSGLRINRAADDAAGLAISEKMRSQIRGLEMAERNAMDGISLMQTSEGALEEVHQMLQRMRELSVQAANDTNTGEDRDQLQKEINQLVEEIDEISDKTEFNTRKLLDGSSAVLTTLEGNTSETGMTQSPKPMDASYATGQYQLDVDGVEEVVRVTQTNAGFSNADEEEGGFSLADDENLPFGEYSVIVRNFEEREDDDNPVADVEVLDPNGRSLGEKSVEIGGDTGPENDGMESVGGFTFNTESISSSGTAKVSIEARAELTMNEIDEDGDPTKIRASETLTSNNGVFRYAGIEYSYDSNMLANEDLVSDTFNLTNNALAFQIGPNANQGVNIDIPEMTSVELGVDEIDVSSNEAANEAIFSIDQAINQLSDARAKLGAVQNRMEHTINNLQVTIENLTSSESRIRDADMAKEMTEFTRNNILNQSATAMLAQANQLPQGVLQLLQ
ncbi:flagellin [Alkalicoccus chagannorensis]|uniref:flagellin N-terminal helical domain-containing protein n=1 Tax=Alkalicoccus chagannorensis TaxID=427072 RepID=UPI00041BB4F8|nr:flagellin [Alkalicoccus chagannorensis]